MRTVLALLVLGFSLTQLSAQPAPSCTAAQERCKNYIGKGAKAQAITPQSCNAAGARCKSACKNGTSVFTAPNGVTFPTASCS